MLFKRSYLLTFLSIILVSFSFQINAKHYYGLSTFRVDGAKHTYSIKQYDSDIGFNNYKYLKIGVGIGRDLKYFFSNDGKYLVVYLTKRRKESDELLIYTTADFQEQYRLKIGKFHKKIQRDRSTYLFPPIFVFLGVRKMF